MAKVVRIGIADRLVETSGTPTNVFWRFLEQVRTVVTSFADLDGNANDISEGDVNRFREIASITVTRDGGGNIATIATNGKTTTISRDVEDKIETLVEVVDAEPTKVTTQTIVRDVQERTERIEVSVVGFPEK